MTLLHDLQRILLAIQRFFHDAPSYKKCVSFRITLGSVLFLNQILLLHRVHAFYTREGYFTGSFMQSRANQIISGWLLPGDWSLFYSFDTPAFVWSIYILHLAAIIAFIFGYHTRLMAFIIWIALLSFHKRYPFIATGEDTLPRVMMFFLMFLDLGKKQSHRAHRPAWPMQCILLQIALGYCFSAIFKVSHSQQWLDGTHNYAMMNFPLKSYWDLRWLIDYPGFIACCTYWVLFSELTFLFLVWNNALRRLAVLNMVLFHIGIFLTLNAFTFSPLMVTTLPLFLTNGEFSKLLKQIRQFASLRSPQSKVTAGLIVTFFACIAYQTNHSFQPAIPSLTTPFTKTPIDLTCEDGYISVPAAPSIGITKPFCLMKYEARQSLLPSGSCTTPPCAVSEPEGTPWVMLDNATAQRSCAALGGHLITDREWIAVARNIAQTPINDISNLPGIQLATGHSRPQPNAAISSTKQSDPILQGCDLSKGLYDPQNSFHPDHCELRGSGTRQAPNFGYINTTGAWSNSYQSGASDSSQLRTHVLSNGEIIWDFAGNVWEWTDLKLTEPRTGKGERHTYDTAGITGDQLPRPYRPWAWTRDGWLDYFTITDFRGLDYLNPVPAAGRTFGFGGLYLNPGLAWGKGTEGNTSQVHMSIRGGYWEDRRGAGIFSLALTDGPSNFASDIGFRCVQ
jgi:hypothetical protein